MGSQDFAFHRWFEERLHQGEEGDTEKDFFLFDLHDFIDGAN